MTQERWGGGGGMCVNVCAKTCMCVVLYKIAFFWGGKKNNYLAQRLTLTARFNLNGSS